MFTIDLENYDAIAVVRFNGAMTLQTAVELRQQLEKIFKESKVKDIALDLSGLRAVDRTGLGALVGISTVARSWGKRLMLYRTPPKVEELLEQSEISGFFPVLEDENDLKARQLAKL